MFKVGNILRAKRTGVLREILEVNDTTITTKFLGSENNGVIVPNMLNEGLSDVYTLRQFTEDKWEIYQRATTFSRPTQEELIQDMFS